MKIYSNFCYASAQPSVWLFIFLFMLFLSRLRALQVSFPLNEMKTMKKKRALNRKCGNEMSPGFDFPA